MRYIRANSCPVCAAQNKYKDNHYLIILIQADMHSEYNLGIMDCSHLHTFI